MDLRQPDAMNFDDGNLAESWKKFISAYTFYKDALALDKKAEKVQCSILLHVIGRDAQEVYKSLNFENAADKEKFDPLVQKFAEVFLPKANLIYERFLFNTAVQKVGQSYDSYFTELRNHANNCDYGDLKEDLIRDRIVVGIINKKLQERLLQTDDLTLKKAIEKCRASEAAMAQASDMKQSTTDMDKSIEKVKVESRASSSSGQFRYEARRTQSRGRNYRGNSRPMTNYNNQCDFCGGTHQRGQCPAWGKQCDNCGKYNHFASVCFQKKMNSLDYEAEPPERDPVPLFIGALNSSNKDDQRGWKESIVINNQPVTFKLDPGAQANTMSMRTFKSLRGNVERIVGTNVRLISYSEHTTSPVGTIKLPCLIRSKKYEIMFHITKEELPDLLGLEVCEKSDLVKRMNTLHTNMTKSLVLQNFPDLFSGIGCLPEEHKIVLRADCHPVINAPRRVPETLKKVIIAELRNLEEIGIIKPVKEPTEWVNSMVTVSKPDGALRICMDANELNEAIIPSRYKLKTIEEVIATIPEAKHFSKLDASKGFWQIPLDDSSSKLCTFNTPIGRYRFTRLPFGICDASEIYQEIMERHFGDVANVIVDDLLVSGVTREEHDRKLTEVLTRARAINLKFNVKKLEVGVSELAYAGHLVTAEGLKADPEKIRAIVNMPDPADKGKLKSFLGMCNYLTKFIPHLSEETAPLRELMKQDVQFVWDTPQIQAFNQVKKSIAESIALTYYDVNKAVTLQVDASQSGLGACLLQDGKPVAYASSALTDTQTRYSQIEKETLAVVFGTEKFHQYIYAKTVKVHTDHKPLESIFKKPLRKAPPRVSRMMLSLQKYRLDVQWRPGKEMHIADALSRSYLNEENEALDSKEYDLEVCSLMKHLPVSPEKYEKFQQETQKDPEASALKNKLVNGWPTYCNDLEAILKPFWIDRGEFHLVDGIIFKGSCIFVPKSMRSEMLKILHESHFGIQKTLERARSILYWTKMSDDIENEIQTCDKCLQFKKTNKKEPMMAHDIPDRPWQEVATDFFELKGTWMIMVDYYSSYFELVPMTKTTAEAVILQYKSIFARHGIPEVVFSDNGPPFDSDAYRKFSKSYGFTIETSSPYHPQSNGKVESAVSIAKSIINKASDPYIALMEYRASPLTGIGKSPAELLFNRNIRTKIPCKSETLKTSPSSNLIRERMQFNKSKQCFYYNRTAAPALPELQPDDSVLFKQKPDSKWRPAVVKDKVNTRSYELQDESGRQYRRNRKFIHRPPPTHIRRSQSSDQLDNTQNTASDHTIQRRSQRTRGPPDRFGYTHSD